MAGDPRLDVVIGPVFDLYGFREYPSRLPLVLEEIFLTIVASLESFDV